MTALLVVTCLMATACLEGFFLVLGYASWNEREDTLDCVILGVSIIGMLNPVFWLLLINQLIQGGLIC